MTAFDKAIKFTLSWEGGYVNDPQDPGGETRFGISKRAHPDVDVRNLTEERARAIYFSEYWIGSRCPELPELVAIAHFDTAVNVGVGRAIRLLQRAAGVTEDGNLGPKTIEACQRLNVIDLLAERQLYYTRLKHWPRFGRGWTRRVVALAALVGGE